jgi:hypothetical protein
MQLAHRSIWGGHGFLCPGQHFLWRGCGAVVAIRLAIAIRVVLDHVDSPYRDRSAFAVVRVEQPLQLEGNADKHLTSDGLLGSPKASVQQFLRRRDPGHLVFAVLGEPQKLSNELWCMPAQLCRSKVMLQLLEDDREVILEKVRRSPLPALRHVRVSQC